MKNNEIKRGNLSTNKLVLFKELLPIAHLISISILIVLGIGTLLTFGTDIGRYVPTGSVLGFQGPSYFYVSGLFAFLISISWIIYILFNCKKLTLESLNEKKLVVKERKILGERLFSNPYGEIKLIHIKRMPGNRAKAWFVFLMVLVSVNVELAFANAEIEGGNLTSVMLFLFSACLSIVALLNLFKPGVKVRIFTTKARLIINFPGIWDSRYLSTLFLDFFINLKDWENSDKMDKKILRSSENKDIFFYCVMVFIGLMMLAGLKLFEMVIIGNQLIAWLFIILGVIGIAETKISEDAILYQESDKVKTETPRSMVHVPRDAWNFFLISITLFLITYLSGKMVKASLFSNGRLAHLIFTVSLGLLFFLIINKTSLTEIQTKIIQISSSDALVVSCKRVNHIALPLKKQGIFSYYFLKKKQILMFYIVGAITTIILGILF